MTNMNFSQHSTTSLLPKKRAQTSTKSSLIKKWNQECLKKGGNKLSRFHIKCTSSSLIHTAPPHPKQRTSSCIHSVYSWSFTTFSWNAIRIIKMFFDKKGKLGMPNILHTVHITVLSLTKSNLSVFTMLSMNLYNLRTKSTFILLEHHMYVTNVKYVQQKVFSLKQHV